ncbi:MAG: hypothetical protein ACHQET_14390 [Chitinophagales bacterium]
MIAGKTRDILKGEVTIGYEIEGQNGGAVGAMIIGAGLNTRYGGAGIKTKYYDQRRQLHLDREFTSAGIPTNCDWNVSFGTVEVSGNAEAHRGFDLTRCYCGNSAGRKFCILVEIQPLSIKF